MSKINTLPTELILEIIAQLRTISRSDYTKALKNLRLINWHFYFIMTPMLFTSISMNIHEKTSLLDYAKSLSSLTTVSGYIRSINIHCVDQNTYYKFAPALHRASSILLGRTAYLEPLSAHKTWDTSLATIGARLRLLTSLSIASLHFSASFSGFWNALRKEYIYIKDPHVQYRIEQELLDYLASYSGLERLIVEDACPPGLLSRWDVVDRRLAMKFAKQVIPKHAQSLIALHVHGHDEGWWSFGRHNAPYYEQCVELREWGVSINSEDVGSNSVNLHRDVMKPCLELANRMPRLECLTIYTSRNPLHRRIHEHGNYHIQHEKYAASLIREALRNTIIPDPKLLRVALSNEEALYQLDSDGKFSQIHFCW